MTREQLQEAGLIVIIRASADTDLVGAARALADGGVRALEIALTTPGALAGIAEAKKTLGDRLFVGAGTILTPSDAEAAISAGAEFIVTPTLQPDTIACCRSRSVPIACGCMTPTEALAAHNAGADFIKVFPAEILGPAYIRALLAPLPFLRLVPTGGVTRENIGQYLAAGSVGVAVGGSLVSSQILRERDWVGLTARAREYVTALAVARTALKDKSL